MKINHKNNMWIWVTVIVLCALSVIRYEHFAAKRHFGDFHVYYVTGQRLLERTEIYFEQEESLTPFKYSPLVASWFALLALLPETMAAGVWHLFNLLLLVLCACISWRLIVMGKLSDEQNRLSRWQIVGAGVFCLSPAILHCLNSGQVGFAIAFFYYLGIYFYVRKFSIVSATCFALASMFKYLPLLVIPYFLFRKDFRFLFVMAIAFVLFHFMPALWLGWNQNLHYLQSFIPHITATTLDHVSLLDFKNQSVWAYVYRLVYYDFGFFEIAEHSYWLTWIGGAILGLIYVALLLRKRGEDQLGIITGLAAVGTLIVIFNPNAWKHNFVLLMLPCMLVLANWFQQRRFDFNLISILMLVTAFLSTNRSILGWNLRYDVMSLSVLPLASLVLILAVLNIKPHHHS